MEKKNLNSIIKKSTGFTLAEVLITLGIIGVVAAMTIPTLVSNTNSQKFKSQYKKSLSTLNQAVRMSLAQDDLDFTYSSSTPTNTIKNLFLSTLAGASLEESYAIPLSGSGSDSYYSTSPFNTTFEDTGFYFYNLADGSTFAYGSSFGILGCSLNIGETIDSAITGKTLDKPCIGFIDVNGKNLPNKEVSCTNAANNGYAGSNNNCTVDNKTMGDIFPVAFHDATVEPATTAAWYVLHSAK